MSEIISKELLSEVFGVSVKSFDKLGACHVDDPLRRVGKYVSITFNTQWVNEDGVSTYMTTIGIYELAHKCKEWALKQNIVPNFPYIVQSSLYEKRVVGKTTEGYDIVEFHPSAWFYDLTGNKIEFTADTEPEAIFKTCEYILDSKDKQ